MKKQLLAAAVAATMSVTAMADISISGNAKFEYVNSNALKDRNKTNTEANLNFRGKSGDTAVVLDLEFKGDYKTAGKAYVVGTGVGAATQTVTVNDDNHSGMDIENMYITTKLGPVAIKAGNYSSGTGILGGEIDEGGRSNGKITLSYTTNGIKIYGGNGGKPKDGDNLNNNMFVGVAATIEGWKLQVKKSSDKGNNRTTYLGVSGKAGPVGIRLERKDSDGKNDVTFVNITAKAGIVDLGFAMIKADTDGKVSETDSDIFAVSLGNTKGNKVTQLMAATKVDGTSYSIKIGKAQNKASTASVKYYELDAKRTLASGITVDLTYTNGSIKVNNVKATARVFEVDLSVKF